MQDPQVNKSIWSRLPSFVWIIIFIAGIAVLIGGIIGFFIGMSTIEGFASALMLIAGYFFMRSTGNGLANGMIIAFYALMGMAIDQPGNVIFNYPIEVWECPADSSLSRTEVVSNPLPERTDITQDFSCVNEAGQRVKTVGIVPILVTRFAEYVMIAYLFMGFHGMRRRLSGQHDPVVDMPTT